MGLYNAITFTANIIYTYNIIDNNSEHTYTQKEKKRKTDNKNKK